MPVSATRIHTAGCGADAAPFFRNGEDLPRFLERCLDDAGVLVTPGAAAGKDYGTFVRLCFTVVPPDELELALAALGNVFQRPER